MEQVINMPPIPISAETVADSNLGEEGSILKLGWRLRLLLCLEDRERTRHRLLVTEVLAGIITRIVDAIPGKVMRISSPKGKPWLQ